MQLENLQASNRRATLAATRAVVSLAAVLGGVVSALAIEGPILSAPSQQLDRVLSERVINGITVPAKPLRVATRPMLDWRPGLKAESEKLSDPEAAKPRKLEPIDEVPELLTPKSEPEGLTSDPAPTEQEAAKPTEPPAAKSPLSLVAPQNKPKIVPDPTITPLPAEASPADDKATAEASDRDTSVPAKPTTKASVPTKKAAKKANPPVEPKKNQAADSRHRQATPEQSSKQPPAPLSRGMRNLRSRMRTVLSFYYRQPMNTEQNDPWELMHSMLSYELHSRVRDGGPNGDYLTAVGHLCFNRPSKRQQMMVVTDEGKLDVQVGVGLQGHKGQLMAMLAQCNVSPDYPIRCDGQKFEIHDLIDSEKLTCYEKTELTFKLIGLGHYLDSDARWLSEDGQTWDIPRLIREELAQPIRGAACGGTHRLAGLSLAFRRREARGEPVDGDYAKAARFVSQYQSYAFKLQNDDGSFSTAWFGGPGDEQDIDRRLRTSGHLLEWLVYSLPDDQLQAYRTVRAVNYLTSLLASNADHEWHPGSLSHAIHALVLYDKRVFRPHDGADSQIASSVDPTGNLFRGYPIYRGVMRNSPPQSNGLFGIFGGNRTGSTAGRRR